MAARSSLSGARSPRRTVPGTSARMFRLRSPFPDLRRHLELEGMQKPGSPAVRKDEQPVVASRRRCPFLLPRFRVAEEVDLAQPVRERLLRREVRQELEWRARVEFAVVPGLEQKE